MAVKTNSCVARCIVKTIVSITKVVRDWSSRLWLRAITGQRVRLFPAPQPDKRTRRNHYDWTEGPQVTRAVVNWTRVTNGGRVECSFQQDDELLRGKDTGTSPPVSVRHAAWLLTSHAGRINSIFTPQPTKLSPSTCRRQSSRLWYLRGHSVEPFSQRNLHPKRWNSTFCCLASFRTIFRKVSK